MYQQDINAIINRYPINKCKEIQTTQLFIVVSLLLAGPAQRVGEPGDGSGHQSPRDINLGAMILLLLKKIILLTTRLKP